MKTLFFYFALIFVLILFGIAVFVHQSKSEKIASKDAFCSSVDEIISAADSDFTRIKGPFADKASDGDEYDCMVHLPGSTLNVLCYEKDVVPIFSTTLFHGTDSLEAYRRYMSTTLEFMHCRPEFKLKGRADYEKLANTTIYGIYAYQDKIVYITYDKGNDGDNSFWVLLHITLDPDNSYYDKIRKLKNW